MTSGATSKEVLRRSRRDASRQGAGQTRANSASTASPICRVEIGVVLLFVVQKIRAK